MNNNTPVKLVLFDLDDTLIQSHINYQEIRLQVIELLDTPIKNLKNIPIAKILDRIKAEFPNKYQEAYRRVEVLEEVALKKAELIPWAEKIPNLMSKYNLQTAIFTNNSRKGVNHYLSKFSFLKSFLIITRDDVKAMKPNPEGLFKIIKRFNGIKSNIGLKSTIFVGDSFIDSKAAHAANIRFIWYNSRDIDLTNFPVVPYQIISHLSELEVILKRTNT